MTCWRTLARSAPEADQDLGGHTFALADEPEEHVLGADVVVSELQRLAQRQLEDLLRPRREGRRPGRRSSRQSDRLFDLLAHGLERHPELLQGLRRHPLTLVDEAEQDVLGTYEAVVEQPRFFLREHQDSASPVSKAFEHSDRLPRRFSFPTRSVPAGALVPISTHHPGRLQRGSAYMAGDMSTTTQRGIRCS